MSTPSTDGLKLEIDAGKMKIGNPVVDANGVIVTTVSNPLSVDSGGLLAVTSPLPITVSSAQATTVALLNLTGTTSLSSGGGTMIQTLVTAAGATTATSQGYARISITDSGGNLTTGGYYIQFFSLT